MYPNNGYPTQQPQERRRRSDRYSTQQMNPPVSSAQGWQQPAYPQQNSMPQRSGYQPVQQAAPQQTVPRQGIPQQAQQMPRQTYQQNQPWQGAPQQNYGRGYHPQQNNSQWGHSQARYDGGAQQTRQGYQPPKMPPQPPQDTGDGQQPPKFNWKLLVAALVLIAVIVVGCMVGSRIHEKQQLENYVASFDNVFCNNVYVDGIHLGGMTQQEAINAVTQKAQQRNDAWSVKLTYQGSVVTEFRANQLGMTVDVTEQLRQAWSQGHAGDTQQRLNAMEALAEKPYQAYSALPNGDTSVVDNVLADIRNRIYLAPQDAAIIEFDPNKTSNPFTYRDEAVGYNLDTEPIKEKIYQMVSTLESGAIEIVPTVIQPQVTKAQLEKLVTLRASAYTKISTTSTENRTNNIKRAFQLINGTVLQPGETFSFNGVVGERSIENGFFEAIEYAYNEQVMGVGGGVCQASSTLYQAAVAAGMQITKREQHSLEVNYTEFGLDATVFWSKNRKIDLAFKNTSEAPIYIVAGVQSDPDNRKRSIAKVSIYGLDLGNVTYKLEAQTTEVLQPPAETKTVRDKKQEYVTYIDEEKLVQKAKEGYVIDSFCVKYVDGTEVERTHLYTDRYEPKQETVYVGIKEREE